MIRYPPLNMFRLVRFSIIGDVLKFACKHNIEYLPTSLTSSLVNHESSSREISQHLSINHVNSNKRKWGAYAPRSWPTTITSRYWTCRLSSLLLSLKGIESNQIEYSTLLALFMGTRIYQPPLTTSTCMNPEPPEADLVTWLKMAGLLELCYDAITNQLLQCNIPTSFFRRWREAFENVFCQGISAFYLRLIVCRFNLSENVGCLNWGN